MPWRSKREDEYSQYLNTSFGKDSAWKEFTIYKNKMIVTADEKTIKLLEKNCKENHIYFVVSRNDDNSFSIESNDVQNFSKLLLRIASELKDDKKMQLTTNLRSELVSISMGPSALQELHELQERLAKLESASSTGSQIINTVMTTSQSPAPLQTAAVSTPPLMFKPNINQPRGTPDINSQNNPDKTSKLQQAVTNHKKNEAYIMDLISKGANLELPLIEVLHPGNELCIRTSRTYDGDRSNWAQKGETPLAIAIRGALRYQYFYSKNVSKEALAHFNQAQILLVAGADPRSVDYLKLITELINYLYSSQYVYYSSNSKNEYSPLCLSKLSREQREFIGNAVAMLIAYGAPIPTLEQFTRLGQRFKSLFYIETNYDVEFEVFKAIILQAYNRMLHDPENFVIGNIKPEINEDIKKKLKQYTKVDSLEDLARNARDLFKEKDRNAAAKRIQRFFKNRKFKQHMNRVRPNSH